MWCLQQQRLAFKCQETTKNNGNNQYCLGGTTDPLTKGRVPMHDARIFVSLWVLGGGDTKWHNICLDICVCLNK